MKKTLVILVLSLSLIILSACQTEPTGNTVGGQPDNTKQEQTVKGDVGNDICQEFSADFIYSVLRKPIVRVEPSPVATVYACDYFTDYKADFYKDTVNNRVSPGGPNVSIILDNLNVEKQKEASKYLGLTLGKSSKINMENIVNYRENKSIWSVDLIINSNRFVWANYSHRAITDDELITLAAAMADKIQGRLKIKIEKNPIDLAQEKAKALGESQISVARDFVTALSNKGVTNALNMMDANDNTKQMWGVNFNTIESLKVNKVEEAYREEWTATRQVFKYELDVKVKPAGLELGWNQGKNYRWITLEKNTSGQWLIHEIANNP